MYEGICNFGPRCFPGNPTGGANRSALHFRSRFGIDRLALRVRKNPTRDRLVVFEVPAGPMGF